jgi:hypothetical protein
MPDVYGGLFLENIARRDLYFELQSDLFHRGLIQGVQIRVAHPCFTPKVTARSLLNILSRLPSGCNYFVHIGAENVGVDLGECWDEEGEFAERAAGRTWGTYNLETLKWGVKVAKAASAIGCTLHPGYGRNREDKKARMLVIQALRRLNGSYVCLENVPPLAEEFWGFGGTPESMADILSQLGSRWKCLIDITHAKVTANQLHISFAEVIRKYLDLPHSDVCHYSGTPETLIDCHTDYKEPFDPVVADVLSKMCVVCLETQWTPEDAREKILRFRQTYKI